ncbi:MAG: T9SS type A sorting domain-containing protein [Agriterribacter sp.]
MRKNFTLLPVFIVLSIVTYAQSATLVQKATLSSTLEEISGIIPINGKLYGHEDSGNSPTLYEIDSTNGAITKTITIGGATNVDWEDLTQDDTYIYIADFGNNLGNRKDLKFYRISKQSINNITGTTGTIPSNEVETINFTYENQVSFCSDNGGTCSDRNTNFDCEAVIYDNNKLHLFTKNWVTAYTVHYTLPITPGTYIAEKKDSLNTGGILITGAAKLNDKIVALLGYNDPFASPLNTHCGLWLITGFTDVENLFGPASQKQKIDLGKMFSWPQNANDKGQVEGIAAVTQTRVLVSSERFLYNPLSIDIPQRLYGLNLDNFISSSLLPTGLFNLTSRLSDNQVVLSWEYTDPGVDYFQIEISNTGNNDFVPLAKVNASDGVAGKFNYTDNSDFAHTTKFYRIKIVTQAGTISYSKIILIKKNDSHLFSLMASPSPFDNKVDVGFYSDTQQTVQINIVDMYGRKLKSQQVQCQPGKYTVSLDALNHLTKGIYFVTAKTKSDLFVRKIVKQ